LGALGEVAGGQEREQKQREGKALGEGRGQGRSPPARRAGPRAELVAFGGAERGCAPFGARAAGAAGWAKAGCFVIWGVGLRGGGERGLVRAGVRVSAGQERERKQREEKALGEGRG